MGSRTLSVVVCAYTLDRWDDLVRCLHSVAEQTVPVLEILLVCDWNPVLAERAREALIGSVPGLQVLESRAARGLSGARNTGVAAARGEIVAFLDDDACAEPTWAEHLLGGYEDETVVGVGGAVLPSWSVPRPGWFPAEFLWVVGCSYVGQPTARAEVRNGIGASMSFRADVLAAVGGFNSSVGRVGKDAGGCEETELSIRARRARAGGRVLLEPASVCRHTVPADRATLRYFLKRCAAEGRAKAVVSALVGADDALHSERSYASRVLPLGVLRGVGGLLRGDLDAGRRALAIVTGFLVTAGSYVSARARLTRSSGPPA